MTGKKAALFFDIDGTILSISTLTVPESTIKALKLARAKGHEIFINTGRTVCALPANIKCLSFDGFLCGCGSYLVYHDEVLLSASFPMERGYRYIDEMKKCNVEGLLEGEEDTYFSERVYRFEQLEAERRYAASLGLGRETTIEKKNFEYRKMLVCTDEKSDKERFFQVISEDFAVIDRRNGAYECIQKQYSKATAIAYMQHYLGFEKDQVYVFGDSGNDLAMFEYADHAVAMKVHDPMLDPYTEYVTDTVENDGIYKALLHYGLIES